MEEKRTGQVRPDTRKVRLHPEFVEFKKRLSNQFVLTRLREHVKKSELITLGERVTGAGKIVSVYNVQRLENNDPMYAPSVETLFWYAYVLGYDLTIRLEKKFDTQYLDGAYKEVFPERFRTTIKRYEGVCVRRGCSRTDLQTKELCTLHAEEENRKEREHYKIYGTNKRYFLQHGVKQPYSERKK